MEFMTYLYSHDLG